MRRARWWIGLLLLMAVVPALAGVSTTFANRENYEDGTVVKPGERIVKTWECTVDNGSDVVRNAYVKVVPAAWGKGKDGLKGPAKPILVESTKPGVNPGATFTVKLPVEVPANLPDGPYELDVRLCDKQGNVYSDKKKTLYVLLKVQR